jgi:hypothetical protein
VARRRRVRQRVEGRAERGRGGVPIYGGGAGTVPPQHAVAGPAKRGWQPPKRTSPTLLIPEQPLLKSSATPGMGSMTSTILFPS